MVGSCVGIATILVREIFDSLLHRDGIIEYLISICGAYGFGMIASFILQRRLTFGQSNIGSIKRSVLLFIVISIIGGLMVAALSILFRYSLIAEKLAPEYSNTVSFVAATLLVSLASYLLNARFVFR